MNTTPHAIVAFGKNGTITIPTSGHVLRCTQKTTSPGVPYRGVPCMKATPYELDLESVKPLREYLFLADEPLIVSTIVAGCANEIRTYLGKPNLQILVPNSGPSAVRDESGKILGVNEFLEY